MKFPFQYSDLNGCEYIKLFTIFVENRHCYATNRNDVGESSIPVLIRLKPDAKLQKQRLTKNPIHYRDKVNTFLDDIQKIGYKQNGSTPFFKNSKQKKFSSLPPDKRSYGSTSLNPLNI